MKKTSKHLANLMMAALLLLLGMSSCSSDDNGTPVSRYVIQVGNCSMNYSDNGALNAGVKQILDHFNAVCSKEMTEVEANQVWKNACDSILFNDWAEQNVNITDDTWAYLVLAQVSGSAEGNKVVNQRKVPFPVFAYSFKTAKGSNLYELNVLVQQEVNNIIAAFYDEGKTSFSASRDDALLRLQKVSDSIARHNWKSNSFAIQNGTYFTLQLTGASTTAPQPWPVIEEQKITLPHY